MYMYFINYKSSKKFKNIIMKRQFKQWWLTIPAISTKRTITSHLNSWNIKKTTRYEVGNSYPGFVTGTIMWQSWASMYFQLPYQLLSFCASLYIFFIVLLFYFLIIIYINSIKKWKKKFEIESKYLEDKFNLLILLQTNGSKIKKNPVKMAIYFWLKIPFFRICKIYFLFWFTVFLKNTLRH